MSDELGGCEPEINQLVLWITVAFIEFKIQLNSYDTLSYAMRSNNYFFLVTKGLVNY